MKLKQANCRKYKQSIVLYILCTLFSFSTLSKESERNSISPKSLNPYAVINTRKPSNFIPIDHVEVLRASSEQLWQQQDQVPAFEQHVVHAK